MRRPANQEKTLDRITRWRETCPIWRCVPRLLSVFQARRRPICVLLDWLREARLTRVGCFKYENVEGAGSRALEGHVPEEVKAERHERLMAAQQEISEGLLAH